MNIQIAKKPITETESDQASPDLANEYSLAMQKANHRNCVQSQWGKSVSKKCVQRVCQKSGSPNDNTRHFFSIIFPHFCHNLWKCAPHGYLEKFLPHHLLDYDLFNM